MKKQLSILCPTYWYPRTADDTQATYVHDINRHLVELGHHVTVVTPNQDKSRIDETFDGVKVIRFPIDLPDSLSYGQVAQRKFSKMDKVKRLWSIGNYTRLQYQWSLKAAIEDNSDIIHAHWAIPTGPSAVAVARKLSIPSVITMHGGDVYVNKSQGYDFPTRWYVKPFLKYVFNNVSGLSAITDDCQSHALAVGAPASKITIIFNGADTKRFSPSSGAIPAPAPYGENMIFACRQLIPRKGIAILLKAAAIAKQHVPDLQVVVAGDGFQREELEKLSQELAISDSTQLLGWVANKDLPQHYRAAAISVIPSLEEGFGIPAAEAMGCELPVISSDAGGLPEVVDDNETGFVVPKDNVEALAEKIVILLKDRSLRERMGKAGREKAVRMFSWENTAKQFENMYRELIQANDSST